MRGGTAPEQWEDSESLGLPTPPQCKLVVECQCYWGEIGSQGGLLHNGRFTGSLRVATLNNLAPDVFL